ILEYPDVTFAPHFCSVFLLNRHRTCLYVPEKQRQTSRLTEHLVVHIKESNNAVSAFIDDGRGCRADERCIHIVGRAGECVSDDLNGDGINPDLVRAHKLLPRPSISGMMREPYLSISTLKPGGTTVVAVASRMIAGPTNVCPARSESRSTMMVSSSSRLNVAFRVSCGNSEPSAAGILC